MKVINKAKQYILSIIAVFTLGLISPAQSEGVSELSQAEIQAQTDEIMKTLNPKKGETSLLNDKIKLSLGDNYYFLDQYASRKVLVDLWGNTAESAKVLGMIFPDKYTPLDEQAWGRNWNMLKKAMCQMKMLQTLITTIYSKICKKE